MIASGTNPIRVLLVEDHPVVRFGLRMLLDAQPEFTLAGSATNRQEAFLAVTAEPPDIILLDLLLGDEDALSFLPELLATAGRARIIVLTGLSDPAVHRRAIALGARGVVLKEHTMSLLLKAIERVQAGEMWIDPAMMVSIAVNAPPEQRHDPETARLASLTEREREIIPLVCEGLANQEIAAPVRQ